MPDTPRTVSELKTIFADNSSGDISAQDMRDFVESYRFVHYEYLANDVLVEPNTTPVLNWDQVIYDPNSDAHLVAFTAEGSGEASMFVFDSAGLYLICWSVTFGENHGSTFGQDRFATGYQQVRVPPDERTNKDTQFGMAECAAITTLDWEPGSGGVNTWELGVQHDAGDVQTVGGFVSITRLVLL